METPLLETLEHIRDHRLVAVIRATDAETACAAAAAAYAGGLRILEVTFTTPGAAEVVAQLRRELPQALVGAGSVVDLDQARAAREAGARFCVSPHTDPQLMAAFAGTDVLYVPGGLTPSELMTGWNRGCRLLKLFPGSVLGLSGLEAILAPLPFLPLIVTGGVDEGNAAAFLQAGAVAVCAGGSVFSRKAMAAGAWQAIEEASARLVAACRPGR